MEYKVINKTYVKSNNSTAKIYLNYTYSLMGLVILICLSFLLFGYQDLVFPLIKSVLLSLGIASIFGYLLNILKHEYHFLDIYKYDHVHIIGLIIGLCSVKLNIIVLILAVFISLVVKKFIKRFNLSAALFGILIILLYKYFTNDLVTPLSNFRDISNLSTNELLLVKGKDIIPYLIGTMYISPVISALAFIYLFYKKSIKYNIVIPYLAVFTIIMFTYGIMNNLSFWFVLLELSCGNLIYLMVYLLPDYIATPSIKEGQVFYGILLGIISAILRFIVPELAIVITFIFGEILISNYLDRISYKFKYNKKLYNIFIFIGIILTILTAVGLAILFKI